ncbi:DinB family protein [Pseudaestuariivita sp.]|uniref:DinB family protein n=1 Tax=Pseudaestuariivita sp. TaxID=2211669 RepID=UPI00405A165E
MPDKRYAMAMARYNHWQNQSLIAAADGLTDAERTRDRGAFFGSILRTLSHIYWGDSLWMSKFAGTPPPPGGIADSVTLLGSWEAYKAARTDLDTRITQWSQDVDPDWFAGEMSWYSAVQGAEVTKSNARIIMHFFNHQTHHRGQVHAMLTAAGAQPGDTDIVFMPD